jgi:hypothetical protein
MPSEVSTRNRVSALVTPVSGLIHSDFNLKILAPAWSGMTFHRIVIPLCLLVRA